MAQIDKISQQLQLKCCGNKFYDFLKSKMDFVMLMFPNIYKGYEVVEGNGLSDGSIILLKYNLGIPVEVKERIAFDDANKSITFECLGGDLLRDFKMFQMTIQTFDNGSNGSSVSWSIEFVKANEDVVTPHQYLLFADKISKGLDDHLCNN